MKNNTIIKLEPFWFSPAKVLLRYAQLEQKVGEELKTASKYKAIREARSVALMLLGIEKIKGREYWLQIVDPLERTPDIRTATHMVETDNRLEYQDVEVVTLESHSEEDVEEFLKRTKLSAEKHYQESTIILCHIDKNTTTKPWQEISSALSGIGKKNEIYLLGRTDSINMTYQLAMVYPKFGAIALFNAMAEAKKKARHTMRFVRGSTRKEWREENEKHEPF